MSGERRWELTSTSGSRLRSNGVGPGRPPGSAAARQRRRYEQHDQLTLRLEVGDCPWCAVYEIEAVDGRPAIKTIRVEATSDPPPPLPPGGDLRALMIPTTALAEARVALAALGEERQRIHGIASTQRMTGEGRRYFLAVIADAYAERCRAGSTSPVRDVADGWLATEQGISIARQGVQDLLVEARDEGLLTPAPGRRRAGGELTVPGHQVIADGPPAGYNGPERAL